MDFGLTEEQVKLKTIARKFFETECPPPTVRKILMEEEKGYRPDLWKKMAKLGWLGLPLPERYGGQGGSFLDLVVLVEEMGAACFPSPFLPAVVSGGLFILNLGNEDQKNHFLPRLADGNLILTLVTDESFDPHEDNRINASLTKDGSYLVNGVRRFVPYAHVADQLLVCALADDKQETESVVCLLVNTRHPGVKSLPLDVMGYNRDRECEVTFDQVQVEPVAALGNGTQRRDLIDHLCRLSTVAKCAEMIGGAQRIFNMAVDYAKQRSQYGQLIGSYQAIQHHCANMAILVDGMKLMTYEAAWKLNLGFPGQLETHMAKAWVSDSYQEVARLAHQVHGAIGFNVDYDLPFYFFQAEAGKNYLGDAHFHRNKMISQLNLKGK